MLSTLALPATLGMPKPLDALDKEGMLAEPDAPDTLVDVSIALIVAGCFVIVMGTAAAAAARARRETKRMVCCWVLVTGVHGAGGRTLRGTGMLIPADTRAYLYICRSQLHSEGLSLQGEVIGMCKSWSAGL